MMRSIIEACDCVSTVQNACFALQYLLRRVNSETAEALCHYGVLPVLGQCLTHGKITIVTEALNTLFFFTKCGEERHILKMTCTVRHLCNIIAESRTNKHIHLAVQCFEELLGMGPVVIDMVLVHTPDIVNELVDLVDTKPNQSHPVRLRSKACIRTLMKGLRCASSEQLDSFGGVFQLSFEVMLAYIKDFPLLSDVLDTLVMVLPKLSHAVSIEELTEQEGWLKVAKLELIVDCMRNGEQRGRAAALARKVTRLLHIARTLKLIPIDFP